MNAQIRDVREEKEDKRKRSEERNVETRAIGGGEGSMNKICEV